MSRALCLALVVLLLAALPVGAAQEFDPAIEARLRTLAKELRCVQCQSETLADSAAPLAVDMRREIRDMIRAGKSDAEIKQFLVARYGEFVLYRPPVKVTTLALWLGPFVLLLLGTLVLFVLVRWRQRQAEAPLDEAANRRAESLLRADEGSGWR
jgi:cytochrome c-type biogenesis protein CcmH